MNDPRGEVGQATHPFPVGHRPLAPEPGRRPPMCEPPWTRPVSARSVIARAADCCSAYERN